MIQVNENMELSLGPITSSFGSVALDEGWLDDETENRQQGFGKGDNGRVHAREGLLSLIAREDSENEFGLIGIYQAGTPVGFVAVDLELDQRLADLWVFTAPKFRKKGWGKDVLTYMLRTLYDSGVYRVQTDLLRINKSGLKFLRGYGFTWESTKKSAYWMDNNVFDVAHLRLLRPDWQELQKEDA